MRVVVDGFLEEPDDGHVQAGLFPAFPDGTGFQRFPGEGFAAGKLRQPGQRPRRTAPADQDPVSAADHSHRHAGGRVGRIRRAGRFHLAAAVLV
jgi:hypothetical protein